MTLIDISLAQSPLKRCFAFAPGEKMRILVNFGKEIPERYRLQIFDHRNNSRLNRYGKGSEEGIMFDWLIPNTIRNEHLGIWHVQLEDYRNNQLLLRSFFFVEHQQRIEAPMLPSGPVILGLPERWLVPPAIEVEEVVTIQEEVQPIIFESDSVSEIIDTIDTKLETAIEHIAVEMDLIRKIQVITIKGLGKTYAERLAKIKVQTVDQFYHYPNRIELAEIMRISDKKLEKMLSEAEEILKKEIIESKFIKKKTEEVFYADSSDLTSLPGIGPKSVEKLGTLGITTQNDLLNYQDHETLRKTLRMSSIRLKKLLVSIGKEITSDEIPEELSIDPLNQPITNLKGIGEKTASKLSLKGIKTVNDFLNSSYDQLKDIISEKSYLKWKNSASIYSSRKDIDDKEYEHKASSKEISPNDVTDLTSLPGIGPKSVEKLAKLGIMSPDDLLNYHDRTTLSKILRMSSIRLKKLFDSIKI